MRFTPHARRTITALTCAAVALGGAAAEVASAKTAKPKPGSYAGTTSENEPVSFTITQGAIKTFSTIDGYNGSCGQGGGPGFTIKVNKIKINAKGKFAAKITLVGPVKSVANQTGELTGTAAGKKVTGKITDLTIEHGTGCKTAYNETFHAHKS